MKHLLTFLALLSAGVASAQQYVDLVKFSIGNTQQLNYSNSPSSTAIYDIDGSITYPIVINDNLALLTGVDYSSYELKLGPLYESASILRSTTLKLGMSVKHNSKLSSTYLLLPKMAADYQQMTSDDFQFGGVALFNYQKKPDLKYRFGLYSTTEAFGFFVVPLFGLYYQNQAKKLEINATLPMAYDVNYSFGQFINIGTDFRAFVRSYILSDESNSGTYVHKNSQDISAYVQFNLLKKSVLLQLKGVYGLNDYAVFDQSEKIDLGVSAFLIGDDRTRLNPELDNGLGFKVKLIYRFHLED